MVNSSIESSAVRAASGEAAVPNSAAPATGRLIVNADDWGRDQKTTQMTLDCVRCGAVSSVSAMVFMEDSERAAAAAREHGVDAGLHLNLSTPLLAVNCPSRLQEHQQKVAKYLTGSPFARGVFNPWLSRSFEYVVAAQIEEFVRIYGAAPDRIDGHHHMHLAANVLLGRLLPSGIVVRRHFSQESGEKAVRHRVFRWATDKVLTRRFRVADFLFSVIPFDPPARLLRIISLAGSSVVEVETHPVDPAEYQFLAKGGMFRLAGDIPIAHRYEVTRRRARE